MPPIVSRRMPRDLPTPDHAQPLLQLHPSAPQLRRSRSPISTGLLGVSRKISCDTANKATELSGLADFSPPAIFRPPISDEVLGSIRRPSSPHPLREDLGSSCRGQVVIKICEYIRSH